MKEILDLGPVVTAEGIHYGTDGVGKAYAADLWKARRRPIVALQKWELLAWRALDAYRNESTEDERDKLPLMLEMEHRKEFSGSALACFVMLPDPMVRIEVAAMEFKVPFGVVFNRLVQTGEAKVENGRFLMPNAEFQDFPTLREMMKEATP